MSGTPATILDCCIPVLAPLDEDHKDLFPPGYFLFHEYLESRPDSESSLARYPRPTVPDPAELFESPCWLAGRYGNLEMIKIVLSSSFGDMSDKRTGALEGAITSGRLDAVELVMARSWEPTDFFPASYTTESFLVPGMLNNPNVDFLTRLFELMNMYSPDNRPLELPEVTAEEVLEDVVGSTPQRPDLVAHLLDMDVSPSANSREQLIDLLHQAVSGGNEKIVELLLARGTTCRGTHFDTVLRAAAIGRLDIVRLLTTHGFPINRIEGRIFDREEDPEQPIYGAILAEHEEMCSYLLEHGAALNLPSSGSEALFLVHEQGLESMVKFLRDRGVKYNSDSDDDSDIEDAEDRVMEYKHDHEAFLRWSA